ncbi:MAG: hypothetical protein AAB420_02650 [Patescibacteria group bacterium]
MKNTTRIGIVVVIAVLIVILIVSGRSDNATLNPSISPSSSETAVISPTATARPASTIAPSTLSYQDAIKKYGGVRFQFNDMCQASPSQLTIKKGAAIMLDNRAKVARTISVGTSKYSLAAYGFRIVTPTASALPATLLIDCGTAQNVAKVIIQK